MGAEEQRIMELYGNKKATTKQHNRKARVTPTPVVRPVLKANERIAVKGLSKELFPYQEEGVAFLESRNGRAILGDSMGLGKTAQALAYLQHNLDVRPAVVLCPSSLKFNWAKEVFFWMEKREENAVYILSGKLKRVCEEVSMTSTGRIHTSVCQFPKTGIFIVNYDVLPNKLTKKMDGKKAVYKDGKAVMIDVPNTGWIDSVIKTKPEIIIADESHYIKTKTTGRSRATSTLVKRCDQFIAISGTLIENRPLEAYEVINLIAPDLFPSRWEFCMRYCDPTHNGYGWDFKGASNTLELHGLLQKIMIRRLKEDVLKQLPPKIKTVIPLDIENRKEYEKAESNLIQWIRANKGKQAANKAASIEALARINALKELCVRGKIEACLNWIEDFLESGEKLVVFTTHTWVLDYIYNEFRDWAVKLDGSITGQKRQDAVDSFQNNRKIKLFVGNIDAAGVGITLTAASSTCFIELPWNPSKLAQAEDRVHRIGQESDSVNAYYLLGQGTIEEEISELLDRKGLVINAVLDGKETIDISLLDELLKGK